MCHLITHVMSCHVIEVTQILHRRFQAQRATRAAIDAERAKKPHKKGEKVKKRAIEEDEPW